MGDLKYPLVSDLKREIRCAGTHGATCSLASLHLHERSTVRQPWLFISQQPHHNACAKAHPSAVHHLPLTGLPPAPHPPARLLRAARRTACLPRTVWRCVACSSSTRRESSSTAPSTTWHSAATSTRRCACCRCAAGAGPGGRGAGETSSSCVYCRRWCTFNRHVNPWILCMCCRTQSLTLVMLCPAPAAPPCLVVPQALQYVQENPDEVCPAGWKPGEHPLPAHQTATALPPCLVANATCCPASRRCLHGGACKHSPAARVCLPICLAINLLHCDCLLPASPTCPPAGDKTMKPDPAGSKEYFAAI